jgi:hypothetical protein
MLQIHYSSPLLKNLAFVSKNYMEFRSFYEAMSATTPVAAFSLFPQLPTEI